MNLSTVLSRRPLGVSTEERRWVGLYWEKDAEDGVARKVETEKAKREVYGCDERGHGSG